MNQKPATPPFPAYRSIGIVRNVCITSADSNPSRSMKLLKRKQALYFPCSEQVLFIPPLPLRDSGQLLLYNMMMALSSMSHIN